MYQTYTTHQILQASQISSAKSKKTNITNHYQDDRIKCMLELNIATVCLFIVVDVIMYKVSYLSATVTCLSRGLICI